VAEGGDATTTRNAERVPRESETHYSSIAQYLSTIQDQMPIVESIPTRRAARTTIARTAHLKNENIKIKTFTFST
jgi:hypothetical protein